MEKQFDAVICGGGLAGLTLARQLRREFPNLKVAVFEKTTRPLPEAAHKVGESSVELGSQYLEALGLRDYLHDRHLIKFGLRFFPGGGDQPIDSRTEIGPINDPVITSYQIDRGRFESDLRQMVVTEDGVELFEGATIRDVQLNAGDENHVVEADTADGSMTAKARWVMDATGRAALLRGRLKLKRGGRHEANASWFRVKGRVDITDMAPNSAQRWHRVPEASRRWLSTNHLMGPGYWVWVIPLSSDTTSIGVVTHNSHHDFDQVRSIERTLEFLRTNEPAFAEFLQSADILDFKCLKNYCHTVTRCWHPDRWALVGEAGAFTDPLYSPGTDYIAFANSFTTELVRADLDGGDLSTRTRDLNLQYRALVGGSIGVYRQAAPVYGHARAMATKIYWDNMVYWSYPCQYFLQNIYRLSGAEHQPFTVVGARFVELSERMQTVLGFWASRTRSDEVPEGEMVVLPGFPSVLIDAHCALGERWDADETLRYMTKQLEIAETLFAELLLRVTQELGPVLGRRMWAEVGANEWSIRIPDQRLEAEQLSGRARRQALPSIVRDVERSLGLARAQWSATEAAAWMSSPRVEVS